MDKQMPFEPMEAQSVDALPDGPGWQFEPKWDGFRCLAVIENGAVWLFAKSGKPLGRYFPEVLANLAALPDAVLDGELVIPVEGALSFDALQMRLHPAESRVRKLSTETPAVFVAFDLAALEGKDLSAEPLRQRRKQLETLLKTARKGLKLSPIAGSRTEAQDWLDHLSTAVDGVVAKRLDDVYAPGARQMHKVKRLRSADCVVGGVRRTAKGDVASLLLGLFDEGRLDHIGFCSGLTAERRAEAAEKVAEAGPGPGFTGRAPGGPSRWSNGEDRGYEKLAHEIVVEVRYDQLTKGRFRHGTGFLRWRPDKAPRQCRLEQLAQPVAKDPLYAAVAG